jgi:hypothetical protein
MNNVHDANSARIETLQLAQPREVYRGLPYSKPCNNANPLRAADQHT